MGVPEVKKDFEWCPHANPGKGHAKPRKITQGCAIYDTRPTRCHDFNCQWLKDERFGDHWFPKDSLIIVDHRVEDGKAFVFFVVDPRVPGRWREEPWFSDIKRIGRLGLVGVTGVRWTTVVLVKHERIAII